MTLIRLVVILTEGKDLYVASYCGIESCVLPSAYNIILNNP